MYLTICCRDFTLCKSVFTLRLPCGRAVLHEVRPYSGWWAARCGAELGERVYAEGKMMRGKYWGNAEEARGNKNPAEPWGLRDENCILLNEDCQS